MRRFFITILYVFLCAGCATTTAQQSPIVSQAPLMASKTDELAARVDQLEEEFSENRRNTDGRLNSLEGRMASAEAVLPYVRDLKHHLDISKIPEDCVYAIIGEVNRKDTYITSYDCQ